MNCIAFTEITHWIIEHDLSAEYDELHKVAPELADTFMKKLWEELKQ